MKYSEGFCSVMANWSIDALIYMGLFSPTYSNKEPYYRRKELYRK